jgi:two-component system nitrogen regulation sensor histidine kinase GlnL
MNVTHPSFAGLDLLASAVLLIDDGQLIRYINAAGENLLAVSGRSVVGKTLADVCTGSATLQSALDNGLNNNWGYTGQNIELVRGDGEKMHLNCTVTPAAPGYGDRVRLLLELQPIEHHLAATREERLIEQQQASRELIRNLAHEIKNPLGGIRGAAQLLEHELPNPALKEYTQVIIKEADRLQDLMQRLLTAASGDVAGDGQYPRNPRAGAQSAEGRISRLAAYRRDYDTSLPDWSAIASN